MNHPPYHLRPNKAVDRLAFVEAIMRLEKLGSLSEYTYYSLGGPYLEDFQLLYEFCPDVKMVSIDDNKETIKRQKFHMPCSMISLKEGNINSFVTEYEPDGEKSIFWLDFTGLSYGCFGSFMSLISKVTEGSMVKITLRSEPKDYFDKIGEDVGSGATSFKRSFRKIMPDPTEDPPRQFKKFACLLKNMVRVAVEKTLSSAMPHTYQPISSFYYSDGTGMLTLTGIVCQQGKKDEVIKAYQGWPFKNLSWGNPKLINVPVLSTKERLHLQEFLPCSSDAGKTLREALGYLIDKDSRTTDYRLCQYADYHRYSPYFMKAVP